MNDLIQLEKLPVEALAEMANEAAAACEASGRKTVEHAIRCGRALLAAKAVVPHGEWADWLSEHFEHSGRLARKYIEIANWHGRANLEDANSLGDALRIIADSPEKQAKKAEREARKAETMPKPPAPSTPAPQPQRHVAETITEASTYHSLAAQVAKPEWLADPDELDRPEEDDLPPLPKTNTHHTPATRQQIDHGPELAPARPVDPFTDLEDGAWYVYRSGKEPAFRLLSKEEILEAAIAASTTPQVLEALADGYEGDQKKRVARQMREAADRLDPPEETKAPTLPQMRSIIADRAKLPPSDDRHLRPPVATAASEWAAHKSSLPKAKRYHSRTSWEACLTRMATMTLERGAEVVCDMIQRAIASGYQGWEFEPTNGRNGRQSSVTAIRTGRNFEAEMGPPINLADVEEF